MDARERRAKQQAEVDANYAAFKERESEWLGRHTGRFVLMKNREPVEFFDSGRDAWQAGRLLYKNDVFSVQEVGARPADFGWMGHVLFHRES